MLKTLGIMAALFFISFPVYAEVAVLPYRVENPSQNFASDSGRQYAKLLSVALSLSTRLEVTSQRDILADMTRFGLNPDRTISADDLMSFSGNKGIDYILTGKLSKAGDKYISESILFSVKEKRTVQRAKITASSLFELTEKDVHEFFSMYEKAVPKYIDNVVDIAFLIDCSFAVSKEWPSIKEGIIALAESLTQRGRTSLRIYLIPFSQNHGFDKASVADNSIVRLKENLNRLRPAAAHSDASFVRGLEYAVKSILWRKDANRKIILITNSKLSTGSFPQQYAIMAQKAGIAVDSIMLGRLNHESAEIPTVLASGTGGAVNYATYHQRVFNTDGQGRELFFERGRLLYSTYPLPSWRQGVLTANRFNSAAAAPREGLEEIHSDKIIADPYNLPSAYNNSAEERIINPGQLENNISFVIKESAAKLTNPTSDNTIAGKITVSDGNASIIIDVSKAEDMAFFEQKNRTREFFNIGVTISPDKGNQYDIRLLAVSRNLNTEDIPSLINVTIKDLVQKKESYMRNGLLSPPVWFIRVQVQQVRAYSETNDIRD